MAAESKNEVLKCHDCPTRVRAKSEMPASRHDFFQMHNTDSSDDEESHPCPDHSPSKYWDVETLYEFDIDTLVRLARGITRSLLPGSCLDPTLKTTGLVAEGRILGEATKEKPGSEGAAVGCPVISGEQDVEATGLDEESREKDGQIEFKDEQIERLRRIVCELLSWGATYPCPRCVPRPSDFPAPRRSPHAYVPPHRRLRASAPEFVPLGIFSEKESSGKSLARRACSAAPRVHKQDTRAVCDDPPAAVPEVCVAGSTHCVGESTAEVSGETSRVCEASSTRCVGESTAEASGETSRVCEASSTRRVGESTAEASGETSGACEASSTRRVGESTADVSGEASVDVGIDSGTPADPRPACLRRQVSCVRISTPLVVAESIDMPLLSSRVDAAASKTFKAGEGEGDKELSPRACPRRAHSGVRDRNDNGRTSSVLAAAGGSGMDQKLDPSAWPSLAETGRLSKRRDSHSATLLTNGRRGRSKGLPSRRFPSKGAIEQARP